MWRRMATVGFALALVTAGAGCSKPAAPKTAERMRYINHLRRAARDVSSVDTHVVLSQVRRLQDRLQRTIDHPPMTNRARHRLRINVKKARYVLEATGRPVTPLVKPQDHLGRWHELMVLSSVAGRTSHTSQVTTLLDEDEHTLAGGTRARGIQRRPWSVNRSPP